MVAVDPFGGMALWVPALAMIIVLRSWARHYAITVPLSTQLCKWVTVNTRGNPAMD